jgi:zinc transporter ZupT
MEEEKNRNQIVLKELGIFLPFATIYIIIVSLICQLFYYSAFAVPIKFFVSLTELGLLISDQLLPISFLLLGMIFYVFIDINSSKKKQSEDRSSEKTSDEIKSEPAFKNNVKIRHARNYSIVLVVALSIGIQFINPQYEKIKWFGILITGLPILIITTAWVYFPNNLTKLILAYLLFLAGLMIYITGTEIQSVENGKYTGTKIYTADTTYTSTDSSYFIGKTEKYIFIYNNKIKSTRIIPSESVLKIDLMNK